MTTTRTSPSTSLPVSGASAQPQWRTNGVSILGALLDRLGDVMGAGALRSLIHYGAVDIGARLADQLAQNPPEKAIQAAAEMLHLGLQVRSVGPSRVELLIKPPNELMLTKPGPMGLTTGIFEGLLTRLQRTQMQLESDPVPTNGDYLFVYRGGA